MAFPEETPEAAGRLRSGLVYLYHSRDDPAMPGIASHQGHRLLRTTCAVGLGMIQGEPPLKQLLSEPIVRLMAQSDGVSIAELTSLCETVREKLVRSSALG